MGEENKGAFGGMTGMSEVVAVRAVRFEGSRGQGIDGE